MGHEINKKEVYPHSSCASLAPEVCTRAQRAWAVATLIRAAWWGLKSHVFSHLSFPFMFHTLSNI